MTKEQFRVVRDNQEYFAQRLTTTRKWFRERQEWLPCIGPAPSAGLYTYMYPDPRGFAFKTEAAAWEAIETVFGKAEPDGVVSQKTIECHLS